MAVAISRKQFLRGDFSGQRIALRPPWAVPEGLFIESCDGCGECIRICPTNILKVGQGKLPEVDFSKGSCNFCGDCAATCKTLALNKTADPEKPPWALKAHFDQHCLTFKGISCYSCQEACEIGAIHFKLAAVGVSTPHLDASECNGCGACYPSCPVNAVSIRPEAP